MTPLTPDALDDIEAWLKSEDPKGEALRVRRWRDAWRADRAALAVARRMAELDEEAMAGVNFTELRNLWRELKAALAASEKKPGAKP